jgi:hypothetical protein
MPRSRVQIPFERSFTEDEFLRVKRGFVPESMEERWHIFLKGRWLYFARSWTSYCIYKARLQKCGNACRIAEVWVSRDPRQYGTTDTREDAAILRTLIDEVLLGSKRIAGQ